MKNDMTYKVLTHLTYIQTLRMKLSRFFCRANINFDSNIFKATLITVTL